jgi:hypothetical protein
MSSDWTDLQETGNGDPPQMTPSKMADRPKPDKNYGKIFLLLLPTMPPQGHHHKVT